MASSSGNADGTADVDQPLSPPGHITPAETAAVLADAVPTTPPEQMRLKQDQPQKMVGAVHPKIIGAGLTVPAAAPLPPPPGFAPLRPIPVESPAATVRPPLIPVEDTPTQQSPTTLTPSQTTPTQSQTTPTSQSPSIAAGPASARPVRVPMDESPTNGRPRARSVPALASLATLPPSVSAMAGLPMAENSYDEISIIGTGAYGTVYKGREKNNPEERLVALKKLRMQLSDEGVPVNALREISLLRHLEKYNHPNIVKLLDICHGRVERTSKLSLILVFEYIEQDLEFYMEKCPSPGIEPAMIQNLMHQIICGIDFLHSHRVVHRDMKPQNILVSRHNVVKIADFGLAKVYDFYSRLTTAVVTLWYRSPEVLMSNSYATPVDMWSCGCIFAELFKRTPLFRGQNEGEQLQKIFNIIGKPTAEEWPADAAVMPSNFRDYPHVEIEDVVPELTPEAADLLKRMITFVPGNRISAKDSLTHPYFSGLVPPVVSPLRQSIMPYSLCPTIPSRASVTPSSRAAVGSRIQEPLRRTRAAESPLPNAPPAKKPSNDENNPNAGNSTPLDSCPVRPATKSPPTSKSNGIQPAVGSMED